MAPSDLPMASVGDVLNDLARVGELPPAGIVTLPPTPRSSEARRPPTSTLTTTAICECGGLWVLALPLVAALSAQAAIIDRYDAASRQTALIPCCCAAGQARMERWRNLPDEAKGVKLRGGRLKVVAAQKEALAAIKGFIKQPRGWVTLAGGYG